MRFNWQGDGHPLHMAFVNATTGSPALYISPLELLLGNNGNLGGNQNQMKQQSGLNQQQNGGGNSQQGQGLNRDLTI